MGPAGCVLHATIRASASAPKVHIYTVGRIRSDKPEVFRENLLAVLAVYEIGTIQDTPSLLIIINNI